MLLARRISKQSGLFFSLFLFIACESSENTAPQFQACIVQEITDGDTLRCSTGERVRLLSIDAPEMAQEPYGALAKAALELLAPKGSLVSLQFDKEPRDPYDRLLAYAYREDVFINLALAEQGYVVDLVYEPNTLFANEIRAAVNRAKQNKRGLWAMGGFDCLPYDHRKGRC